MKILSLFCCCLLFTSRLLNADSPPAFPVDVERSHPVGVIQGRRGDLSIIADNLLPTAYAATTWPQPKLDFSILSAELVSWALKYQHSSFPPSLLEECILLVSYSTNGIAQWKLGYMNRSSSTASWRPATHYDQYLGWVQSFSARPSASEISAFLKDSNFGYNDFLKRELMKVVLYMDDELLLDALSNPVSDEEKERRREISESFVWNEPLPSWAKDLIGVTYHYSRHNKLPNFMVEPIVQSEQEKNNDNGTDSPIIPEI